MENQPVPSCPALRENGEGRQTEKVKRFALNGAGALVIALVCPLVWKPLFLLSPGFVIAAFVIAIVAIVKGRPLTGAILIAACPVVMFGAFIWFTMPGDIVSETRKQHEREARPVKVRRKGEPGSHSRDSPAKPLSSKLLRVAVKG